jgi:diacylglycerol kinase family enzyme
MRRSAVVILNAASGPGSNDATLADRIATLFEAAGADASVVLAHGGAELSTRIDEAIARRPDVIVAGGGDGTVSSVAAALADGTIALGVLPLGTLNHFAKDLGLPLELEAAVEWVARGAIERVDIGEVNGRVFINNSSLGLYPAIVRDRELQRKRLGRGKWPALAWASLSALRRFPFLSARLSVDGVERRLRTPFVFIGNNEYLMEGFAIGERDRLDDGRLSVYVVQRASRASLLLLALRALVGRLKQARDFEAMLAGEIVIESRHRRLRVATDGEITLMAPPLRYRIRPKALLVVAGARDDAGSDV